MEQQKWRRISEVANYRIVPRQLSTKLYDAGLNPKLQYLFKITDQKYQISVQNKRTNNVKYIFNQKTLNTNEQDVMHAKQCM